MNGRDGEVREVRIASWRRRLGAWLIDIILVGILWDLLAGAAGPITQFHFWLPPGPIFSAWFVHLGSGDALILFAYWTVLEGTRGQSLGKMALGLKVTDRRGDAIDLPRASPWTFSSAGSRCRGRGSGSSTASRRLSSSSSTTGRRRGSGT